MIVKRRRAQGFCVCSAHPVSTGKTTDLAERVKSAVRLRGPDSVLVASFTNTAAHEIGSRGLGLPRTSVGTLHSHAYRIIGSPQVALDDKVLKHWNEMSPRWAITAASRGQALSASDKASSGSRASTPGEAESGDELLASVDLLRSRGVHTDEWPPNCRTFYARWSAFKRETESVDFTDMTMEAYRRARDGEGLPANFIDVVVDEAQDCTPAELALAMEWGRMVPGHTVFGFDDDQTIAQWRGGDPAPLLALDEDECDTIVLDQSHRVPPAVHACAVQWVERISNRYSKAYVARGPSPERGDRDDDDAFGYAYRVPFDVASDDLVHSIERDLEDGVAPMILASCGYMLNSLIAKMRKVGLPFHNPYRKTDGQWNPLGGETGTSTAERVARYLRLSAETPWTGEDIALWSELLSLPKAGMVHGAKRYIDNLPKGEVPWKVLAGLWKPGPPGDDGFPTASADLAAAVTPDLEWFAERVLGSKQKVAAFPLQVARTRGPSALTTGLRAVPGTIHAVKGATSTKVYLSPDLSAAGGRQWLSDDPNQSDQIRRLMYVGMTRAYRELVVMAPNGNHYVDPAELVPRELEVRRPGTEPLSSGRTVDEERARVRAAIRRRGRSEVST